MGVGEFHDTAFLINFGLAKQYHHQESHFHIPMQECSAFVGTPAFTSVNSHFKYKLSRWDDLKSLVYLLMFLHHRSLPWLEQGGNYPSHLFIQGMKESIKLDHSGNIPGEIISVLTYVRSLSFTQKPDYDHVQALLLPAASFTLSMRAIAAMAIS